MAMNLSRHFDSFADMHYQRAKGDPQVADAIRVFYEEYFATMDLTADFYLETVDTVFQRHSLPLHELEVRGRKVEPSAIRRTALLTIEGERDDICAVGQTLAAQDLCDKLRPYLKTHHVQTGVGHYGVFNGKRWERHIYPRVRAMIHDNEASPINVNARSQPIVPLQSIPPMHNPAAASVLNEPGKTGKAGKTGADIKAPQRRSAIAPEHMIDPQELAEDVPGTQAVKSDGDSDLSASRPS
jgi:poly(3-hydroxybutyrate) depolymerase